MVHGELEFLFLSLVGTPTILRGDSDQHYKVTSNINIMLAFTVTVNVWVSSQRDELHRCGIVVFVNGA